MCTGLWVCLQKERRNHVEIGLFSVHVDYFELVDAEGALLSFPLVVDFYDLELFVLARLYLVQGSIVFANLQLKLIFAIQSALLRLAAALLLRLSLFNGLVRVHFHLCPYNGVLQLRDGHVQVDLVVGFLFLVFAEQDILLWIEFFDFFL